jgi:hypothetical protein
VFHRYFELANMASEPASLSMRFASALLVLALGACERPPAPPPPVSPRAPAPMPVVLPEAEAATTAPPPASELLAPAPPRAVLVTLDGVRWQDFLRGEDGDDAPVFPCVHELVKSRGVALADGAGCGIVRPAGRAYLSLPGYLEIFSGAENGCWSNECPRTAKPTVLDDLHASGLERGALWSVSSWSRIARAASDSDASAIVLAGTNVAEAPAGDTELADILAEGKKAGGFPGTSNAYRPDTYTVDAALHVLASDSWRFVHVGLGDADEYGHRADREHYMKALAESDDAICRMQRVAEDGDPTLFVVVADHGRADDFVEHGPQHPESGRSFFASFGTRVSPRGFVCSGHDVLLTDVAPLLLRWFARDESDTTSFEAVPETR